MRTKGFLTRWQREGLIEDAWKDLCVYLGCFHLFVQRCCCKTQPRLYYYFMTKISHMSSFCHQRSLLITLCTTKHPHWPWHTMKRCSLIQSVHKWHKLITHSKHCCKSVNTSPDCCRTPSAVCSFPLTHTNVFAGVLACLCNSAACLECFFPSVSYSLISVMHMSETIVHNCFEKKTKNSYWGLKAWACNSLFTVCKFPFNSVTALFPLLFWLRVCVGVLDEPHTLTCVCWAIWGLHSIYKM